MDAPTSTKPLDQAIPAAGDQAGAARGALPNLVVIGAQKCGTSGLHYQLGLHPEIWMSRPKELNFFIEERSWSRGEDWYRAYFDARREGPRRVVAQLHGLPAASRGPRADALGDPRREADLRGPRPAGEDRGPLGPQLRQAPREGRPARHPDPCQHLVRGPKPVPHAAAAVPRALPARADARDRAGGAPHRARGDAPPGVRVRRRGPGLQPPSRRQAAPSDLAQDARQPSGRAAGTAEPARAGAASCRRTSGWRSTRGWRGAVRSSGPTSASPSGQTCCRSCARTPSGSAS